MYDRSDRRDRRPYRVERFNYPAPREPEGPSIWRRLLLGVRGVALWALGLAPLAYVILPVRTYTEVLVEVQDQTGAEVKVGTAFLLDATGAALDRVSLSPAKTTTETYDEPAAVRVVADGCGEARARLAPTSACHPPALSFSDLPSYLKHGGVTYYARRCHVTAQVTCAAPASP